MPHELMYLRKTFESASASEAQQGFRSPEEVGQKISNWLDMIEKNGGRLILNTTLECQVPSLREGDLTGTDLYEFFIAETPARPDSVEIVGGSRPVRTIPEPKPDYFVPQV